MSKPQADKQLAMQPIGRVTKAGAEMPSVDNIK